MGSKVCPRIIIYNTVDLTGTGDQSEYDIENYWKVIVMFQERYVPNINNSTSERSFQSE